MGNMSPRTCWDNWTAEADKRAVETVEVPTKRSLGKVRFHGQKPTILAPREPTQGSTRKLGDTVQVVVQKPSLVDGSRYKGSNSSKAKIETVGEDDETDIVTTRIEQPEQPETQPANPDADFHRRYVEVKSLAWTWVKKHFSNIAPEAKRSLNLLHLAHTSPQLMEYANWISCCGQKRTWEGVFNEQRAMLVYGILGKMLEVHVFGHEMFGADENQLRALRELDIELVNTDGTSFLLCPPCTFFESSNADKLARLLPSKLPRPENPSLASQSQHAISKIPPLPYRSPRLLY